LQTLEIAASADAFQGVVFGIPVRQYKPIESSPGFFMNYNVSGTETQNSNSSVGGILGFVGFNKNNVAIFYLSLKRRINSLGTNKA
jgi:outer membrane usher protein FimD/PapC